MVLAFGALLLLKVMLKQALMLPRAYSSRQTADDVWFAAGQLQVITVSGGKAIAGAEASAVSSSG